MTRDTNSKLFRLKNGFLSSIHLMDFPMDACGEEAQLNFYQFTAVAISKERLILSNADINGR
jgi:hypothetical protein